MVNHSAKEKGKKFWGRRLGRPLNSSRKQALDELLPKLHVNSEDLYRPHKINPQQLFLNNAAEIILEIGFGDGLHLKALCEREPQNGFIGVEPYINGMSGFLKSIQDTDISNVRVFMDDVHLLLPSLQDQSLDKIYILNPDPWHKKRHHKRRIINPANLDSFARLLKPEGLLILSTDVSELADWMITHTFNHPAFTWLAKSKKDWNTPPHGWIKTTYEGKNAKGSAQMTYLLFEKRTNNRICNPQDPARQTNA